MPKRTTFTQLLVNLFTIAVYEVLRVDYVLQVFQT